MNLKLKIVMNTKLNFYTLVFACILICNGCNDDNNDKKSLNTTDQNFVQKAALANKTEIEMGQLAATKGNTQMTRDFGQHMVNEHTIALNELKSIGDKFNNIVLAEDLDQQHQQIQQTLNGLSGYSFDSLYIASQIVDHQTTKTLFETEATSGTEQSVKDYASKYLPHINEHLQKADSIKNVLVDDGN
jgi:putative membrane protein